MIFYLIKSTLILLAFITFYKLLLERENMHVFKRFYLLISIVIAFSIPLITFTQYIETIPKESTHIEPMFTHFLNRNNNSIEQLQEKSKYTFYTLWTIYGIGVLLFGFRLLNNLRDLYLKIKQNIKIRSGQFYHVLLLKETLPHTFFKYIFLNKQKYENKQIPREVLLHEQAHVVQKHSIDILFIEIVQVLLWFNPLLYFIKKAIKLNHEFLADKAVLNKGIEQVKYQQTLLIFSSKIKTNQLSNAINYASLKKRFILMKTQTSKTKTLTKSLLLLPLISVLIYGFSTTVLEQQKEVVKESKLEEHNTDSFNTNLSIKDIKIEITKDSKITLNNDIIVAISNLSTKINKVTKDYNSKQLEKIKILLEVHGDVSKGFVTDIQIELRKTGLNILKIKSNGLARKLFLKQQKATPEQLATYNRLAKNYNMQSRNQMIIKINEKNSVEYIYSLMSNTQKKEAEPYPDFPPTPPKPVDVLLSPSHPNSKEILTAPLPPKPPITPLDQVIEMAKKNALFYYEGKRISSDRAIDLLKKSTKINISTSRSNSDSPIVKLFNTN